MASRPLSLVYNGPYNPSEWMPMGGASPRLGPTQYANARPATQNQQTSPRAYTEDSHAAPPPPYTPRFLDSSSRTNTNSTQTTTSPAFSTTQQTSPLTAATTVSPGVPPPIDCIPSRPSSVIHTGLVPPRPPPPPVGRSSRASSLTPADRAQASHPTINIKNKGKFRQTIGAPSISSNDALNEERAQGGQSGQPLTLHDLIHMTTRPPASRRAASTSAASGSNSTSLVNSRAGSRSPSRKSTWASAIPLPGPPPGPPPNASRSQSASGVTDLHTKHLLNPAPRPKAKQPPQIGTKLGPVPPTPAGWADEPVILSPKRNSFGLQIDTTNIPGKGREVGSPIDVFPAAPGSGLFRSAARREPTSVGIRERRNASKNNRTSTYDEDISALSMSSNPWAEALAATRAADLDLGGSNAAAPTQTSGKSSGVGSTTPKSAQVVPDPPSEGQGRTTPRPSRAKPPRLSLSHLSQTPPFSPGGEPSSPRPPSMRPAVYSPRTLPTPPLQQSRRQSLLGAISASDTGERPVSHLLHLPNDSGSVPAPLSPRRLPPSRATSETQEFDIFVQESMKRHQAFLEKERKAATDEDRLRLFSDYIIVESRLRRRRYNKAWSSGAFDVRPVRERLFEQAVHMPRRSSGLSESMVVSPVDALSPGSTVDSRDLPPEGTWWSNYKPCLSPIASMSKDDEMSSRGRTSSRWWESQTGSASVGGCQKVRRSKRESKYMGMPKELREAMQRGEIFDGSIQEEPSGQISGDNEYPAEKSNPETFGIYDEQQPPQMRQSFAVPVSQLPTPRKLDVSRLVTLPPPYPRHYPTVNNSHPDLVSYRTVVRSVSDFEEVSARKKRYRMNMEALRNDHEQKIMDNRHTFRSNTRSQIEDGSITFAEAAEAEESLRLEERDLEKHRVQAEFDSFQDMVLNPLHEILNDRITEASKCLHELSDKTTTDAQSPDPNRPQEEGDEQPELLEKLTQLKWLFEARENIHREIFGLLSDRNQKFKQIVTLPYQQSNNKDKMRDTEAFFASDERDRRIVFENDALSRHQHFLKTINNNVARGVEMQLSAFWDIAPGLVETLESIPEDLTTFGGIEIPSDEYEENPAYLSHPLQYLYSLLSHAQKSSYQFIESQTNLLCLLHEAKTGVMVAELKVREYQDVHGAGNQSEAVERIKADIAVAIREQEETLTTELKDRVETIEEQWDQALGSNLENTKERIRASLMEDGGWEEIEEDGED